MPRLAPPKGRKTRNVPLPAWDPADLQVASVDGSKRSLRILAITFPGGNPKVG